MSHQLWKKIIKPYDIVGIKTNVWSYLATPRELEDAIKKKISGGRCCRDKISVEDRKILRDPFQKSHCTDKRETNAAHY